MSINVLLILSALTAVTSNVFKNSSLEGNILYGDKVPITTFPYAVFLQLTTSHPASCGASLTMVQVIITAASCLTELKHRRGSVVAYLGHEIPINARCIRRVINYRTHAHYNEYSLNDNIAVAFLDSPVQLGMFVKKIPLINYGGERLQGYGVGWGRQVLPKPRPDYPNRRHLRSTAQRIIGHKECKERTRDPKIRRSALCSVSLGGHFYGDDAGSGLVFFQSSPSSPMYLGGVLSHVINEVSVYTALSRERDWVISTSVKLFEESCNKKLQGRRSHCMAVENATCETKYFNKTNDGVQTDKSGL